MPNLTYTVRSTYPRLYCNTADKATITTRTNTAASWQTFWDGDFSSYSTTLEGTANSSINGSDSVWSKYLVLALKGWIDSDTSAHDKLLSAALDLAGSSGYGWSLSSGNVNRRFYLIGLALAYDFLRTGVITFSEANRKTIGDKLLAECIWGWSTDEYLDGHSGGNVMAQLAVGITLANESGSGYNYTTTAAAQIDEALDFWYGASPGDECGLNTYRYFCGDGGYSQGTWYTSLALWKTTLLLNMVEKGFIQNSETPSSLQLNSEDYDVATEEDWLGKVGEFLLNAWLRGDNEYFPIHDTQRITNPYFHHPYHRAPLAYLIARGGAWRKSMNWLHDQWQAIGEATSTVSDHHRALDVVWWDPADSNNTSTPPESASPAISTTRLFKPPGSFWHRNTWDVDNSCIVNIECRERGFYGHNHLMCGAIQISVKDDVVLCHAGRYHTSDATADYGETHHRYYYQQSIAHSGVPLIEGPITGHNTYLSGTLTTIPNGLGGQCWKQYLDGGDWKYDPDSITDLRYEGSNEAWHESDVTLVADTTSYAFLNCNIRRAYLPRSTYYGDPTLDPTTECDIRYLVIKGESVWPIILRLVRIRTRKSSYPTRSQFHSWGNWTISYPHSTDTDLGDTVRGTAKGYAGTGKVLIDSYDARAKFTWAILGGGSTSSYGSTQFAYDSSSNNYPPSDIFNSREARDIGRYRLTFKCSQSRTDKDYLELIMPMGVNDGPLAYTWIDQTSWWGVKFSATSNEYKIHKDNMQVSTTSTDTTPPDAPTGLTVTPTATQQLTVSWTPNSEADMASYKIYYRQGV